MDWNQPIDLYCERTAEGLFAEPCNLISNLAFLIAAYLAYRYTRRKVADPIRSAQLLCGLLALVGIGSSLFHSFATRWAMLTDTAPIQLFIISFFWLWLRKHWCLSPLFSVLGVLLLLLGSYGIEVLTANYPLNGSQAYIGTAVALSILGLIERSTPRRQRILLASLVFCISVTARTLDNALCELNPLGLHCLWHLLNGVVCYLAITAYTASNE